MKNFKLGRLLLAIVCRSPSPPLAVLLDGETLGVLITAGLVRVSGAKRATQTVRPTPNGRVVHQALIDLDDEPASVRPRSIPPTEDHDAAPITMRYTH